MPSDANTSVSPIRKLECITLSSVPGVPGPQESGISLKRMNDVTSAPSAPR
jgi:hypothetical protein